MTFASGIKHYGVMTHTYSTVKELELIQIL